MPHVMLLAAVLAVGLLTACGSTEGGPTTPAGPPASTGPPSPATPSPTATSTGLSTGYGLPADLRARPAVAKAIADAASRQHVPQPQVAVAAWSPVTWDDGSTGCPEPGKAYSQATVDGELLILRVDMTLLAYHAGSDGTFRYCADPQGSYTVRPA